MTGQKQNARGVGSGAFIIQSGHHARRIRNRNPMLRICRETLQAGIAHAVHRQTAKTDLTATPQSESSLSDAKLLDRLRARADLARRSNHAGDMVLSIMWAELEERLFEIAEYIENHPIVNEPEAGAPVDGGA